MSDDDYKKYVFFVFITNQMQQKIVLTCNQIVKYIV